MREKQRAAVKTIRKHMLMSAGAGLIPVPLVDLAAVASVQMMVLSEISKIYGVPFSKSRGKAIIFSMIGFVLPHAMAFGVVGTLLKAIPGIGVLAGAPAMSLFTGAYTWALGNVFIQHFEAGGTFLNFDPDQVKEYFQAQFEEGKKVAGTIATEEKDAVPKASGEA